MTQATDQPRATADGGASLGGLVRSRRCRPASAKTGRGLTALGMVLALVVWLAPAASAAASFSGPTNFPAGSAPESVAVGDFDGDSDVDLAVANVTSGDVTILSNNGTGTFTTTSTPTAGDVPISVAAGDLDGDGDPDLAVANFGSDNVTILSNNGTGTFTTTSTPTAGDGPISVAAGDLDGDGDPDLAVANLISGNVSVLHNTTPRRTTAPPPGPGAPAPAPGAPAPPAAAPAPAPAPGAPAPPGPATQLPRTGDDRPMPTAAGLVAALLAASGLSLTRRARSTP